MKISYIKLSYLIKINTKILLDIKMTRFRLQSLNKNNSVNIQHNWYVIEW